MNIWLINHYAVPTKYYPLARPATFAKYLMRMGHNVTIFAASTVHNSDKNLISDRKLYRDDMVDGIHYVYIRDCDYTGNGFKRILNMILFPMRLPKVCKKYPKPDAIISTSVTPMACMKGIKLSKKYNCKGIAEIADLWPETFVAYGLMKKGNPILSLMYKYEKKIYEKADSIVFTMEGGKDYIIEKKWDINNGGTINLNKIYNINNGVDLEEFHRNIELNEYFDDDLDEKNSFKVVYTGSIRRVNMVNELVSIAEILQKREESDIKIIIFGDGDQVEEIKKNIEIKHLKNIVMKGAVSKKYIPSILKKSDLNIYFLAESSIFKYGMSLNKTFEYYASGKPVLTNRDTCYSIIEKYKCGVSLKQYSPSEMAKAIVTFSHMPLEEYNTYCINAVKASEEFDFKGLTKRLESILEIQK